MCYKIITYKVKKKQFNLIILFSLIIIIACFSSTLRDIKIKDLQKLFPAVQLVKIDSGHNIHYEKPDELIKHILLFIND